VKWLAVPAVCGFDSCFREGLDNSWARIRANRGGFHLRHAFHGMFPIGSIDILEGLSKAS